MAATKPMTPKQMLAVADQLEKQAKQLTDRAAELRAAAAVVGHYLPKQDRTSKRGKLIALPGLPRPRRKP